MFARAILLRHAPHRPARPIFRRYLAAVLAAAFMVCGGVFGFNVLLDPLWYAGGNKIFPRNYAFNERLSKTNLLLDAGPASFDCLVLGSSRATLLDATRIRGHRCFNYSFSAGQVREFTAFARYARAQGADPRLVIVNVDAEHFRKDAERRLNIPSFIALRRKPPNVMESYLTYDALGFSLGMLMGMRPNARYYDARFLGDVVPGADGYRYQELVIAGMVGGAYDGAAAADFAELRAVFPSARYVAFVAPVSRMIVARREAEGTLQGLLDAQYAAAALFDAMHDFSAPSAITADSRNYYDDGHFHRYIYDRVGDVLNGERPDFGVDVRTMSRAEYGRAYAEGLTLAEAAGE